MACITHERPVHINSKGTISCLEIAACKVLSVKVSNLIHKLFPVFLHCQNNRPKQTAASRTTYVIFKHIQETGRVVTAPAITSLWWILQTYVVAQAFHKDLLGLWRNFASMCISEQLNHLQAHTVPFALLPEHTHTHTKQYAHLFGRLQLPYSTEQLPICYVNKDLMSLLNLRFDGTCCIHTDQKRPDVAGRARLG